MGWGLLLCMIWLGTEWVGRTPWGCVWCVCVYIKRGDVQRCLGAAVAQFRTERSEGKPEKSEHGMKQHVTCMGYLPIYVVMVVVMLTTARMKKHGHAGQESSS